MAQIATILPVTPQAPTAASPASSKTSAFSPHLENAISNTQQPAATENQDSNTTTQETSEVDTSNNETANNLIVDGGQNIIDQLDTATAEAAETLSLFTQEVTAAPPGVQITPGNSADISNTLSFTARTSSEITINTTRLSSEQQTATVPEKNSSSGNQQQQQSANTESKNFPHIELETSSSVKLSFTGTTPTSLKSESEALLVRLQQIINNSNETGTVTITKSENSPTILATTTDSPELKTGTLVLTGEKGLQGTMERSEQQLTGLRQGTQQQYYEAKVDLQNNAENNTGTQDSKQGTAQSQQTAQTTATGQTTAEGEPVSTFSQQSSILNQETTVQAASESGKPVILPSSTIVYEENVVQQLIERFQISRRLADTKINLKLHPAELGELKIDISVKDGAIKANVVAQSQQVQEIIERNIAKLRNVLEDQGFTIDQISVTSESESVGDFDLFDKQLFSQNDYTPSSNKNSKGSGANFNPESVLQDVIDDTSGVNVRI